MIAARRAALAAGIALAACDGGGDGDGRPDGGAADGGAGCAPLPPLDDAWRDDALAPAAAIVARLSGETPIRAGVVLEDRASDGARAETRDALDDELAALGLATVRDAYGAGENVYAAIDPTGGPASTPTGAGDGAPSSWLVLGAHFDSVPGSPGANDNASGVAAVLAVARTLVALPCRERGVVVAFFDEEEIGLVGSARFADRLAADELAVDSVHTIDQLGWDDDGDRAIELELPDGDLADRYRAAAAAHGLAVPIAETETASSDHQAFRAAGFAAVGVTEEYVGGDTTPHYHLPDDRYDTVDVGYLVSAAALVAAVVGDYAVGVDRGR